MPNWCRNHIEIHATPQIVEEIQTEIKEHDRFLEYCAPIGEWDYKLACETWGTKWDILTDDSMRLDIEELEDDLHIINIETSTAWAPPLRALAKLKQKEGVHSVKCHYIEDGMCFCGFWDNGQEQYLEYDFEDKSTFEKNKYLTEYWNLNGHALEYDGELL